MCCGRAALPAYGFAWWGRLRTGACRFACTHTTMYAFVRMLQGHGWCGKLGMADLVFARACTSRHRKSAIAAA